jgi:hypothetical protein
MLQPDNETPQNLFRAESFRAKPDRLTYRVTDQRIFASQNFRWLMDRAQLPSEINTQAFLDVTPCRLANIYRRFGGL